MACRKITRAEVDAGTDQDSPHHYSYSILGVTGVVATVLFASPGNHSVGVGPVAFDLYWFLFVTFGALLMLQITTEYDPVDYRVNR